jgi:hypothetical protein
MSGISTPLSSNTLANVNTPLYSGGSGGVTGPTGPAGSGVTQLVAGTGISLNPTTGVGAVTVSSSGAANVAGTANQINATVASGVTTLSLAPVSYTGATGTNYANPSYLQVDPLGRVVAATAGVSNFFSNKMYVGGSAATLSASTSAYLGATATPITYPLTCPASATSGTVVGTLQGVALSNTVVLPNIGDFYGMITIGFRGGSGYTVTGASGSTVQLGFTVTAQYQQGGAAPVQFNLTNAPVIFNLPATYAAGNGNTFLTFPFKWVNSNVTPTGATGPNDRMYGLVFTATVAGATSVTFAAATDVGLSYNVSALGAPSQWFYGNSP